MQNKNTVESMVAQTILQKRNTIEAGGKTYWVAPPSLATLIKVSELVSLIPEIDVETDRPISETLRVAKDCRVLSDIITTIILGAKRNAEEYVKTTTVVKRIFFGLVKKEKRSAVNEFDELSSNLLYGKTPKELNEILIDLLTSQMDIGFFLSISISLSEINMTKPTKKETTASGQQ